MTKITEQRMRLMEAHGRRPGQRLRIDDHSLDEIDDKIALLKKAIGSGGRKVGSGIESGKIKVDFAGTSMEPTLKTGYSIMLGPPKDLKPGDVLVFRDGNLLVCHRMILMRKGMACLKGDGRMEPDRPVRKEEIIGKVCSVTDAKGRLVPAERLRLRLLPLHSVHCRLYAVASSPLAKRLITSVRLRRPLYGSNRMISNIIRRMSFGKWRQ